MTTPEIPTPSRAHLIVYGILRPAIHPLPETDEAMLLEPDVRFQGTMTTNGGYPKVNVRADGICVGDLLSVDASSPLFKSWFQMEHNAGYSIKLVNWHTHNFMMTGRAFTGRAYVFHHEDTSGKLVPSGNWLEYSDPSTYYAMER